MAQKITITKYFFDKIFLFHEFSSEHEIKWGKCNSDFPNGEPPPLKYTICVFLYRDNLSEVVLYKENLNEVVLDRDSLSEVVLYRDNLSEVFLYRDDLSEVVFCFFRGHQVPQDPKDHKAARARS